MPRSTVGSGASAFTALAVRQAPTRELSHGWGSGPSSRATVRRSAATRTSVMALPATLVPAERLVRPMRTWLMPV
ncbi:hypothetical protein [Streptomyces sp. NPDC001492]